MTDEHRRESNAKPDMEKPEMEKPATEKQDLGRPDLTKPGGGPDMPSRATPREPPVIDATADEVKSGEPRQPAPDVSNPDELASALPRAAAGEEKALQDSAASGPDIEESAAVAPEGKSRIGFAAVLGAGVAGAAVALAGGYALVSARVASPDQIAASEARQSAAVTSAREILRKELESKIAAQSQARTDAVEKLAVRLAAVEQRAGKIAADAAAVRQAANAAPAAPAVDLSPLESRVAELGKRIAAVETALQAPKSEMRATNPDVGVPARRSSVDLAPLEARIKALESRPQPSPVDLAPLEARLKQVGQRLASVAEKIPALEQQIEPLQSILAQTRQAADRNAKEIETSSLRADSAALAVVAGSLAQAVRSGRGFPDLLKAAQALGAEKDSVAVLSRFADRGVPSLQALTATFQPLSSEILNAAAEPPEDAGLAEKLASAARRLVRISPASTTNEETPAALVVRISAALSSGKPAEALALFEKIPEPLRKPASDWAASLRNRVAADRAAESILATALARLGSRSKS